MLIAIYRAALLWTDINYSVGIFGWISRKLLKWQRFFFSFFFLNMLGKCPVILKWALFSVCKMYFSYFSVFGLTCDLFSSLYFSSNIFFLHLISESCTVLKLASLWNFISNVSVNRPLIIKHAKVSAYFKTPVTID